jgi:hypothetical protein
MNLLLDYEAGQIKDLILMIDAKLSELVDTSSQVDDPDGFGYFDSAEHLIGLGCVTCQAYMTAVYGILGIDKSTALSQGPEHPSGTTIASAVNHAANYWKHNNEWAVGTTAARQARIEAAFEGLGFPVGTEYPLSGILMEVSSPDHASFQSIMTKLDNWRVALQSLS